MIGSLRNRLILSHVIPLVIVIPLLGAALTYLLETQVLLPSLAKALSGDARLLAEVTRSQSKIWTNSTYATRLLDRVSPDLAARIMLIDPVGRLLASSDAQDDNRVNEILDIDGLDQALEGDRVTRTNYSQRLQGEIVDIMMPVRSVSGEVIGIVRMSYPFTTVSEEFYGLRYFIVAVLIAGLLGGIVLGYLLALNIGRPVVRVTQAVYDLASGKRKEALVEQGPEEVRQLARSVNFLVNRLGQLDQARQQLLASLIHELGRPLGALRAAVQTLSRGAKNDPELLDEFLKGMDGEAARLQQLMEDLHHLQGQLAGVLELHRQSLQLNQWLPEILLPWQQEAHQKDLAWVLEVQPGLPAIEADPLRLAQAIGNLVSNAIKYTPAGGTVELSSGAQNGTIWIRVRDTGPGIPKDEQEKIFTPFFRSDRRKEPSQGMGLGLSIARDWVIAHGGKILIESSPGAGSCFTILLPRRPFKV